MFAFAVRMHERYLFPAMVMFIAAFAVRLRKEIYILYSLICAVVFYNAAYVLFIYDVNNFDPKAPIPIAISIGLLLTVAYMVYVTAKTYFAPANEGQEIKAVSEQLEKEREEKKTDKATESKNREYLQK